MDQASASSAASCAGIPVAPRTSSSCSQSADQSQTGVPPPARSAPQSEPHAEPSNRDPSPSSPPSADSRLRAIAAGVLLRRSRTIRPLHWGIIAPALTAAFGHPVLLRDLRHSLVNLFDRIRPQSYAPAAHGLGVG